MLCLERERECEREREREEEEENTTRIRKLTEKTDQPKNGVYI